MEPLQRWRVQKTLLSALYDFVAPDWTGVNLVCSLKGQNLNSSDHIAEH